MTTLSSPDAFRVADVPRLTILGLGLVLCTVFGQVTPYVITFVGLVLLARSALRGELAAAYSGIAPRLYLTAFGLLALTFALNAKRIDDLIFAIAILPLALYGPLALEVGRATAAASARRIALLALTGAGVALLMTLFRMFVLGQYRADSLWFNTIPAVNTTILLGFLALIGLLVPGPRRWLFLFGPLFGLIANTITGSRGPLLAVIPLVLVAAVFIARHFGFKRWHVAIGVLGFVAVAVLITLANGRSAAILGGLLGVSTAGELVDTGQTTGYRLTLWLAGLAAFLQSPLIGHGWGQLMSVIVPFVPAGQEHVLQFPHLHNDIADFAVGSGILGLIAYATIIATPLVAVLRSPRDSLFAARRYGVLVLTVLYLCAGLTDALLGFAYFTALHVALSSILIAYCRERTA